MDDEGYRQQKGGSLAFGRVFQHQVATALPYEPTADPQSEPCALVLRLGREVEAEDSLLRFLLIPVPLSLIRISKTFSRTSTAVSITPSRCCFSSMLCMALRNRFVNA